MKIALGLFGMFFILGTTYFFLTKPQIEKIIITSPVSTVPVATPAAKSKFTSPKPREGGPLNVPFTSQAPFGDWKDPRQQDGCEEAAVLMAMKWVKSELIISKQAALDEILLLSKFQEEKYGNYHDTSAVDTVKRLFNDYYSYYNVEVKTISSPTEIISELELGNLIITPMNGQALKNPHFTQPGPQRHNIVVKGFDKETREFITNDPGIRQGENYRYPKDLFFTAIRDYPTGNHVPITEIKKVMIVIY